ncbi:MAG TPA: rhomboid family intramembrane serine protease [Candidatus Angelobacter sp.]|nr:rhomboid family intramembrane serine protease [Candidatus Angelobacter sp.]
MFPISDDAPRSTTPYVNYLLIILNILVFLFEVSLGPRDEATFVAQYAFFPSHVNQWLSGSLPAHVALIPFFSSMFMHAGFLHLLVNMWALAIFGDNIEDHLGHFRYLLFYLVCGLGADVTHYLFNLNSRIPSVGASGAIAGVMGAYFVLFPKARVLTWAFTFFLIRLPAWLVLGYWFVLQFLAGAASAMSYSRQTTGGVAVWAHVGGFITGLILIKILPARRQYYSYEGY